MGNAQNRMNGMASAQQEPATLEGEYGSEAPSGRISPDTDRHPRPQVRKAHELPVGCAPGIQIEGDCQAPPPGGHLDQCQRAPATLPQPGSGFQRMPEKRQVPPPQGTLA
jgi:hypothetical protein